MWAESLHDDPLHLPEFFSSTNKSFFLRNAMEVGVSKLVTTVLTARSLSTKVGSCAFKAALFCKNVALVVSRRTVRKQRHFKLFRDLNA